jgi:hypothetical protein
MYKPAFKLKVILAYVFLSVCISADQGPSAGKEWFWLLNNPRLDPNHLLPALTAPPTPGSSSGSSSSGSSRPWRSVLGCWWEPGWSLGAVSLHAWPAHRDKMRALAVDPGERWVATAGGHSQTLSIKVVSGAVLVWCSQRCGVVGAWVEPWGCVAACLTCAQGQDAGIGCGSRGKMGGTAGELQCSICI